MSAAVATGMLLGCSPYPDEGEFFAGVVYGGSFLSGVKALLADPVAVSGRGHSAYSLFATGGDSSIAVSSTVAASSPLWFDGNRRDPLSVASAQKVYVFDNQKACSPKEGAEPFDPRLEVVNPAKQYPIFTDLPEALSTNAGRAGRTGSYSAIVEIVHVNTPAGMPCQSVKRQDTVEKRIKDAELTIAQGTKEYRLLQIVDPAVTRVPLPFQLGWFNQLIVPYLDMGPVPLDAEGKKFLAMPLYNVVRVDAMGMNPTLARRVVVGASDDQPIMGQPVYSPVCRNYQLAIRTLDPMAPPPLPPPDLSDPAYAPAMAQPTYAACLVCRVTADAAGHVCPNAKSEAGAR